MKNTLIALESSIEEVETSIVPSDLWELLSNEEQDSYSPKELAEVWLGESDAVSEIAFYRVLKTDGVYFSVKNAVCTIHGEKKVSRLLEQQSSLQAKKERSEAVIHWFLSHCTSESIEFPEYVVPVVQSFSDSVINDSPILSNSIQGKVLEALNLPLNGGAFQLLVKIGHFSADENLLLHRFHVRKEFPDEVLEASAKVTEKHSSQAPLFYDRFREGVEVPVFTIDDEDTFDRDDGLSFEMRDDGTCVTGIHVTDVSAFIKKDSPIDQEAFKRATSVYLPDVKFPMVPEELSSGCLSLLPGTSRRCVSVFISTDREGTIIDSRCALTNVKVEKAFTYNEVLELLLKEGGNEQVEFHSDCSCSFPEALRQMRKIADNFSAVRKENGSRESEREFEMKVVVKDDQISTWKLPKKCPARTLIAEMAIIANSVIASTLKNNMIPAIYRSQSVDATFRDEFDTSGDDSRGIKPLLNKVVVSVTPSPHSGLGVDTYTQATSPIRRYCDLVIQRQLVAFLSGVEETPVYEPGELEFIIDGTSMMTDGVKQIERWGVRYWLLKYLKMRKGEILSAKVLEKRKEFLLVELTDYLIKGRLYPSSGSNYVNGDVLSVEVTTFNPRKGFIRLKESC